MSNFLLVFFNVIYENDNILRDDIVIRQCGKKNIMLRCYVIDLAFYLHDPL
jgi:hypothetical protein